MRKRNKTDEAAQWMRKFIVLCMTARELLQDDQGMCKEFKYADAGNALEWVQRVHKPADLWDITF